MREVFGIIGMQWQSSDDGTKYGGRCVCVGADVGVTQQGIKVRIGDLPSRPSWAAEV